ncbi:MAG: Na+/H+ antiporter subunit E [Halobacteria archaeon]|nr:Na+/H+ antiporter subunit E [Halobacteria archaeon]
MRNWLVSAGVLGVVWIILHSAFGLGGVLSGVVLGTAAILPFRRMYPGETSLVSVAKGIPPLAVYIAIFTKDVLVSNVDVAWRVLSPSMPINPTVIELPLRVESDAAVAMIANSITLTPGTLTMDYDEESHSLYVHTMTGEDITGPVRVWEKYAMRVFDRNSEDRQDSEV